MTSCRVDTTRKGEDWGLRVGGGGDFICHTWQRKFWKMRNGWTEKNVSFESEDTNGVNSQN
jgi:hypothetical protein